MVLVEGITDHYYFSAMGEYLGLDEALAFVPAMGVDNLPVLASLCLGWGYDFKAVFDSGKQGNRAERLLRKKLFPDDPDEFARRVHKLKGAEGVEDLFSRTDFARSVLGREVPANRSNSVVARSEKKELLGRLFSDRLKSESVQLSRATKNRFSAVFEWLDDR